MARILLFGEPMVLFIAQEYGKLEDVSSFKKGIAGAEYNVSIGLSRLDHQPVFVTKLGANDPMGEYIYNEMRKLDIDISQITFDDSHRTGIMLKSKEKDKDPEIAYYRSGSAASTISKEDINKIFFDNIDHIHLTGIGCALSNSCMEAAKEVIKRGKEYKIPISFDPNLRPSLWENKNEMIQMINELAFQCELVLPGIKEGRILTNYVEQEDIADFYLRHGVKEVIIKLGAEGAFYKTESQKGQISGFAVDNIIDTVGAGDGFAVGVISGKLEGLSIEEYVQRGNCIGALQLLVEGDNEGLPDRSVLEVAMQREEKNKWKRK